MFPDIIDGPEGSVCPICLEGQEHLPVCVLEKCSHSFHVHCIDSLRCAHIFQGCPLCREPLPRDPEDFFVDAMKLYREEGDMKDVLQLFQRAAMQGHREAALNLGYLFSHGQEGVDRNDDSAYFFYLRGASLGYSKAMLNLGILHLSGRGCDQSDTEALLWFERAATLGLNRAQHKLGIMYKLGRGTEKNEHLAAQWFQKSAEQGLAEGCFSLASLHKHGDGTPQDFEMAIRWFRKAALQGHIPAQRHLGLMYIDGHGGKNSKEAGLYWLRRASSKGDLHAREQLLGMEEEQVSGIPCSSRLRWRVQEHEKVQEIACRAAEIRVLSRRQLLRHSVATTGT